MHKVQGGWNNLQKKKFLELVFTKDSYKYNWVQNYLPTLIIITQNF